MFPENVLTPDYGFAMNINHENLVQHENPHISVIDLLVQPSIVNIRTNSKVLITLNLLLQILIILLSEFCHRPRSLV